MRIASMLLLLPLVLPLAVRGQTPATAAELPPLPPLTSPATNEQLAGKFVWADIFSDDIAATRHFYEGLLGWDLRWISEAPEPYGIFSVNGYDVAGLAYRDVEGEGAYARWVHYLSVADVGKSEMLNSELGGSTVMRHDIANRGEFAIFLAPEQVLLGVLRSSSGDPEDARALEGEWIWHQLYTWNLDASTTALQKLVPDYEVEEDEETGEIDRLLVSQGYLRAGLLELAVDSREAPTWIGFIRVADVSSMLARVDELGGQLIYKADSADMAIIAGPGGALIGLLQYTYPEVDQ